ncbi:MAG: AMIN domain-containing protein [Pseudomonadota bacterium]
MIRVFGWLALVLALALPRQAETQELSGLARVIPGASAMKDVTGGVEITLSLTQGVPFRVFTLADPERLVMDFREVDWSGVDAEEMDQADGIFAVRMGGFRPGWSRMVVDLNAPLAVATANADIAEDTGAATLVIRLQEVDPETFVERSGAPRLAGWAAPEDGLPAVQMGRKIGRARVLDDISIGRRHSKRCIEIYHHPRPTGPKPAHAHRKDAVGLIHLFGVNAAPIHLAEIHHEALRVCQGKNAEWHALGQAKGDLNTASHIFHRRCARNDTRQTRQFLRLRLTRKRECQHQSQPAKNPDHSALPFFIGRWPDDTPRRALCLPLIGLLSCQKYLRAERMKSIARS